MAIWNYRHLGLDLSIPEEQFSKHSLADVITQQLFLSALLVVVFLAWRSLCFTRKLADNVAGHAFGFELRCASAVA